MPSEYLTIVVGVGASYDCVEKDNADFDPDWQPPLVKDIFQFRKKTFNEVLKKYSKAETLSDEIRSKLQSGRMSIESLLRQYSSEADSSLQRLYWEVPLYLQELFGRISDEFVISGATRFETLVRIVSKSSYKKCFFLTLNYDLFLEKALKTIGYGFHKLSSYTPSEKKISLVKLHGSVNWGIELKSYWERNSKTAVEVLNSLSSDVLWRSSEIAILDGYQDSQRFREGKFYYPALAVPVEGKSGYFCPPAHIDEAKRFLTGCSDFVFIGFSAIDQDILELLKNVRTVEKLRVVNGGKKSARQVHSRLVQANDIFGQVSSDTIDNCLCSTGFKDFVGNGELEGFLGLV